MDDERVTVNARPGLVLRVRALASVVLVAGLTFWAVVNIDWDFGRQSPVEMALAVVTVGLCVAAWAAWAATARYAWRSLRVTVDAGDGVTVQAGRRTLRCGWQHVVFVSLWSGWPGKRQMLVMRLARDASGRRWFRGFRSILRLAEDNVVYLFELDRIDGDPVDTIVAIQHIAGPKWND